VKLPAAAVIVACGLTNATTDQAQLAPPIRPERHRSQLDRHNATKIDPRTRHKHSSMSLLRAKKSSKQSHALMTQ
jgi:hypothetical protein